MVWVVLGGKVRETSFLKAFRGGRLKDWGPVYGGSIWFPFEMRGGILKKIRIFWQLTRVEFMKVIDNQ